MSGARSAPARAQFLGVFRHRGAALWSGTGIALGAILFHDSVDRVLGDCWRTMGSAALIRAGRCCWRLFIAYQISWSGGATAPRTAVPRIAIGELLALIDGGHDPLIIDARSLHRPGPRRLPFPARVLYNVLRTGPADGQPRQGPPHRRLLQLPERCHCGPGRASSSWPTVFTAPGPCMAGSMPGMPSIRTSDNAAAA